MSLTNADVEYTYLNDATIQYKFLRDKMSLTDKALLTICFDKTAPLIANQNRRFCQV